MPVSLSNVDLPNEEHVRHREPNTWAYLSYNSSQTSTSISKLLGRGTLVIGEESNYMAMNFIFIQL
ncbi:hypothetical protein QR98_0070160 [Sarcoptes scabiei]|uniref:Uncharacterized protein n=1 Tax=Sarcoptes scabiei TaxID=52283 RepID=A0A132AD35_SARSC|nr:hypothetical protein QR98_0070160 [Sarcoptes scabiei]